MLEALAGSREVIKVPSTSIYVWHLQSTDDYICKEKLDFVLHAGITIYQITITYFKRRKITKLLLPEKSLRLHLSYLASHPSQNHSQRFPSGW